MVLALLVPLLALCWLGWKAVQAKQELNDILVSQYLESAVQTKAHEEVLIKTLRSLGIGIEEQLLTQAVVQKETLSLFEPFVTELANSLQSRMDTINKDMAVLTTRVETGPGRRTLRV